MRLLAGTVVGLVASVVCAVVLGDYPVTGSVPWVAAILIPVLIGVSMTMAAGSHPAALWLATGPLAAGSLAWGVLIATGFGIDPVPASCWIAVAIALVWPAGWALILSRPGLRWWSRSRSSAP